MITPEQLADIKHEMEKGDSLEPSFALELIAMIERLAATLTAKDQTLDQIDTATKRLESKIDGLDSNIGKLLKVIEKLSDVIAVKDRVLSQFADSGNWNVETTRTARRGYDSYVWDTASNPITLARQALSEGKE